MTTVTLNPSADAGMRSNSPSTNYNSTSFMVGEHPSITDIERALIKFDLSTVPSGAITSSRKLRLQVGTDLASSACTIRVYLMKRNWVENQATWNVYSTGNSWQIAGATGANDYDSSGIGSKTLTAAEPINQYIEIDLDKTAIESLISGLTTNYGFLLKMETENNNAYEFYSSSVPEPYGKPELVIEYTLGGRQFQAVIWF